jgi:phage terminase large subunit
MAYNVLNSQVEFMEIPHMFNLDVAVYQGGYGSGKTFCGSLLGVSLCKKYTGIRGLVGALTFPIVRDTTLVSYFEHLDYYGYKKGKDYEFYKTEAKIKFSNGSEIIFRHLEESEKLKSLNLGFVEIEEMSDIPENTFKMLLGRLRQQGVPRYRIFGHTNPEPVKGWIYKTFIENPKPNYRMIIAPTTQNIYLPEGYAENLKKAYDQEYYRINVLGEFGDYSRGLVAKGFDPDVNIRNINYCRDLGLHIGCDFNVDPMCWVLAHKTLDKIYFIDEIIIENASTLLAVEEFYSRYPNHSGPLIINGDASGDFRSPDSEWTNYAQMRARLAQLGYKVEVQIKGFNPPVKNRIAAWNTKIKNADGEVGIYISPKCRRLIYNIENLKYKEGTSLLDLPSHHQVKNQRDLKFLGHPFDAASYIVDFYWPIRFE